MKFLSNYPEEVLILLFLTVTFIQSGIDKLLDWNGNLSFIKEHFKSSPLKNSVPLLLGIILVIEIALLGIELSAMTLIFLLIGQRLAKDYAGAMTLAVYFIITIIGIYLLNK
jgi:putative oxidoreductase